MPPAQESSQQRHLEQVLAHLSQERRGAVGGLQAAARQDQKQARECHGDSKQCSNKPRVWDVSHGAVIVCCHLFGRHGAARGHSSLVMCHGRRVPAHVAHVMFMRGGRLRTRVFVRRRARRIYVLHLLRVLDQCVQPVGRGSLGLPRRCGGTDRRLRRLLVRDGHCACHWFRRRLWRTGCVLRLYHGGAPEQ